MKNRYIIEKELGDAVLMIGVAYKNNAPGGMAAVVQYYAQYFENLRYIASWKSSNAVVKLLYGVSAYLRVIMTLLFDRRIKVLHIHSAADASFWRKSAIAKLGKLFGKRVLFHIHASRFRDFYNESEKKSAILSNLKAVDCLIVLSNSLKKWFEGIGVPVERIEVLHNITEYPVLSESASPDRRKTRFLFLGEIGPRKGVFDILRGMKNHREDLDGRMELKIGGNKNEAELMSAIKEGGLGSMVTFEGWVSGEKKRTLLNWADVYILPSFNEGLPIGILEAMSYGCSIITTRVGGIADVVEQGKNGVFVTPGDDEGIVEAIRRYIDDPELIRKEGTRNQELVKAYYPDCVLGHLSQIYTKMS